MQYFEDIRLQDPRALGCCHFTAEEIRRFAAQFDPQPFHLDEEAGRNSLFGGLAASGWHVGSAAVALLVADWQREEKEMRARGEEPGAWGPSPGFRDMRWTRPVLAGDTLDFVFEVVNKRRSASRPGWGLMEAVITGTNQRGEKTFTVTTTAFVPVRGSPAA
ncbi:MAG: MaoC family dehydratase [Alphaproteobacteria bacterium]|nr:MaoC family dehydratase [Alphaproteobacteria bacterium]